MYRMTECLLTFFHKQVYTLRALRNTAYVSKVILFLLHFAHGSYNFNPHTSVLLGITALTIFHEAPRRLSHIRPSWSRDSVTTTNPFARVIFTKGSVEA